MVKPCTTQNMHWFQHSRHVLLQPHLSLPKKWRIAIQCQEQKSLKGPFSSEILYWIESANGFFTPQNNSKNTDPPKQEKKKEGGTTGTTFPGDLRNASEITIFSLCCLGVRSWRLAYNPNRRDLQLWPLKPPQKRPHRVSERLFRKKGRKRRFLFGVCKHEATQNKRRRVWHHIGTMRAKVKSSMIV